MVYCLLRITGPSFPYSQGSLKVHTTYSKTDPLACACTSAKTLLPHPSLETDLRSFKLS